MKKVKVVLYTLGCIGLGIILASWEIEGRTSVEHAQRAWAKHVAPTDFIDIREGVKARADRFGDAKRSMERNLDRPVERHTDQDRAALNRILAERAGNR